MKKVLLFICLFWVCCTFQISAQVQLDFLLGNAAPFHELNKTGLSPADINTYGANITYVPKKIGVSAQFMLSEYTTNEEFLDQFQNFNTNYDLDRDFWLSSFVFVGPVINLGNGRFHLELFPKIGMGFIKEARREVTYTSPMGTEHLLYNDNTPETNLDGNSLFSGFDARLNIDLTKNIGINLGGGFNTNRFFGEGNSTIYREVNTSGDGVTEEELTSGRLLQLNCKSYDLFHISAGISLKLGKKKKDKKPEQEGKAMLPPKPIFPEDQSKISQAEADSLVLEWIKETPNVDRANYQFYLYKKQKDGAKDSLVFNTKIIRNTELELPEKVQLQSGVTYLWKVQATDDKDLNPCPDGCNSITYEFEVATLAIPQFYQMLDKNIGNYVPSGDMLRFMVSPSMLYSEKIILEIFDEDNQVVKSLNDFEESNQELTILPRNRYELLIKELAYDQYFVLKVSNGKRAQFLRFYKPSKPIKDDKNEK
jgi:hypothetical protein